MKDEQNPLSAIVLSEITRQLVMSSISEDEIKLIQERRQTRPKFKLSATPALPTQVEVIMETPQELPLSNNPRIRELDSLNVPTPAHLQQRPRMPMPQTQIIISGTTQEKVGKILSDPAVIGLECPGPDKNLIVNRSGRPQPMALTFTKEEIDDLLKEYSRQSRIPLIIPGVFKAVLGPNLITAVTSEFIGTKFMIQKRTNPIAF